MNTCLDCKHCASVLAYHDLGYLLECGEKFWMFDDERDGVAELRELLYRARHCERFSK